MENRLEANEDLPEMPLLLRDTKGALLYYFSCGEVTIWQLLGKQINELDVSSPWRGVGGPKAGLGPLVSSTECCWL